MSDPLYDFLEMHSKRCPKCDSTQLSSDNNTPLNHHCLGCDHRFPDNEAKPCRARETKAPASSGTGT